MAGLSTHVLDTSKGKPAAELKIKLYKIQNSERILIKTLLIAASSSITNILDIILIFGKYEHLFEEMVYLFDIL